MHPAQGQRLEARDPVARAGPGERHRWRSTTCSFPRFPSRNILSAGRPPAPEDRIQATGIIGGDRSWPLGSSFAAMNTMYAAVARRSREIGTLRVLGFSRGSILFSFFVESVLLAGLGGVLGCPAGAGP